MLEVCYKYLKVHTKVFTVGLFMLVQNRRQFQWIYMNSCGIVYATLWSEKSTCAALFLRKLGILLVHKARPIEGFQGRGILEPI